MRIIIIYITFLLTSCTHLTPQDENNNLRSAEDITSQIADDTRETVDLVATDIKSGATAAVVGGEKLINELGTIGDKIANALPEGYQKDTQQGADISEENIRKLTKKMSKSEVRALLGSPTITDPFHNNRWDYINNSTVGGKKQFFQLTLIFDEDNQLIKAYSTL